MDAGFDARDLVDGLVEHLRNLLLVRATPSPERLVGRIADYEKHKGASSTISEEDLVRLLRIGIEAQASVKWSTQPALIVELALVRMARLTSSVDIADVLRAFAKGGSPAPSGGGTGSTGGEAGRTRGGNLKKSAKPAGVASGGVTSTAAKIAVAETSGAVTSAAAAVTVAETSGGVTPSATLAAGDGAEGDVEPALWPDVLENIRRQKPALAAFLNEAVPAAGEGAVLELAVPNGSRFHKDQLRDRGNMRLMERAAGEVFGGRVKFAFTFGEAPQERNSSRRAEVNVSEETAEDPVVRKVLDMFGGEIRGSRREE
jgi:DNA polymerase-3 subunit gamma/tau